MFFDIEEVVYLRKEIDWVRVLFLKKIYYVLMFLIRLMFINILRYCY